MGYGYGYRIALGRKSISVPAPAPQIWKVAIFGSGQFDNPDGSPYDLNMEYLWDGIETDDGFPVYHTDIGVGPDGFHPEIRHYDGFWHIRFDGNSIYTTPDLISPDWNREDSSYPFAPAGDTVSYDLNSFINSLYFPDGPDDYYDTSVYRSAGGTTGFYNGGLSLIWNFEQYLNTWSAYYNGDVYFTTNDFFHYAQVIGAPSYAVIGYSA